MKKRSIFAASTPNSFFINVKRCSYFYGYMLAVICKDIRLSFLCGLHLLRCNLSLATWGKVAFLLLCTLIFLHEMPNSEKNYSSTNNSNANVTPDCESVNSELSPLKKVTVSEDTLAYVKCLQHLDKFYVLFYDALEKSYGWNTAEKLLQDEYYEKGRAIRDLINEHLCVSIDNNIDAKSEITEI